MLAAARRVALGLGLLVGLGACATVERPTRPEPEPSPAAEVRALWVSRFEYDSPARVAEIVAKAARGGFNVLFFQVRGAADAWYRSALEPCAVGLCGRLGGVPSWDPLEVAVREAHARGLQLHVWLNALTAWPSGSAAVCAQLRDSDPGQPTHVLRAHPEWRVVDDSGAPHACPNGDEYVYLSPAIPAVRAHVARVAADLVRRYPIDGVHLDRIRLPGPRFTYDSAALAAFGRDPRADPAAWAAARQRFVELVVRAVADSVRAVRPVPVSAAVWGVYEDRWGWNASSGRRDYFQDPRAWAAAGILDAAVPMTYVRVQPTYCAPVDWLCLLDDHLQGYRPTGRAVIAGVRALPEWGAEEVLRQIRLARARGAAGVSVYSFSSADAMNLWDALARTVFAYPAAVPPWPRARAVDGGVPERYPAEEGAMAHVRSPDRHPRPPRFATGGAR